MPQLLLELFSEEIPARMQAQARARPRAHGARAAGGGGLAAGGAEDLRRAAAADPGGRRPAAGAGRPASRSARARASARRTQALDGFLRSTGLTRDQLVERDGVWFAAHRTGPAARRPRSSPRWSTSIVRDFPWPKSMTWGVGDAALGAAAAAHPLRLRRRGRAVRDRRHRRRRPDRGPPLHGLAARPFRVARLRRLRRRPGRATSWCSTPRSARSASWTPRARLCFARKLRAGRGRGPAGRGRRPGRMAGRRPGRHGPGLPRPAARGDPHLHAHAPAVFRRARSGDRLPGPALRRRRQYRGQPTAAR